MKKKPNRPKLFDRLSRPEQPKGALLDRAVDAIDDLEPDERWEIISHLYEKNPAMGERHIASLVESLMDSAAMWEDIAKLCDGLAKTLDEYGKIPYTRSEGGEIIVARYDANSVEQAELDNLRRTLHEVLTSKFYESFADVARKKNATAEKAEWFARAAVRGIARRMIREETSASEDSDPRPVDRELPWDRDQRELGTEIVINFQYVTTARRLKRLRAVAAEPSSAITPDDAARVRRDLDEAGDRLVRLQTAWSERMRHPSTTDAQKEKFFEQAKISLTGLDTYIIEVRRILGLAPETEGEIVAEYEAAREETYAEAKRERTQDAELPWDRDARELGADLAFELRMLAVLRRLKTVRDELASADHDEERERLFRTARNLMDWRKKFHALTSDHDREDFILRGEVLLKTVEEEMETGRAVLGMLPETQEEVVANYESVREETRPKTAGIFDEIGAVIHAIHTSRADRLPLKEAIGFRPCFAGLSSSSDDRALMQLGVALWNDTYRTKERAEAEDAIRDIVGKLYMPTFPLRRELAISVATFAALWAHDAFQKVVTTHTYAAALMCTDANGDALSDLHLPWRAFMIAIPDGLLAFEGIEGQQVHLRRALVHVEADGRAALIIYDPDMGSGASNMLLRCAPNLVDLLFDPPIEISSAEGAVATRSAETRAVRMVQRLVAGILVTLLYTQDYKKPKNKPYERGSGREDKREPEHRVTFVGKPLKIDCRAEIKRFIAKPTATRDPKAPAVQYMVRGHQKRQVIGVGRTGRKVIWIEPYWKGDPEAPILTKPRLVH